MTQTQLRCGYCNGAGCDACHGHGTIEKDNSKEVYKKFTEAAKNELTADVLYATGMIITDAILMNCCVDKEKRDKDIIRRTFDILKSIVMLEIAKEIANLRKPAP